MLTEIETNRLLQNVTEEQKQMLADTLNEVTGQTCYTVKTIDRYTNSRIPNRLLQPVKRFLLNEVL